MEGRDCNLLSKYLLLKMSRGVLNSSTIENSLRWVRPEEDRSLLLQQTKDMISELRLEASSQLKLPKIEGSNELLTKLDEILREVETEFDRIADTIYNSDMVYSGVLSLCKSAQRVHEYFGKLRGTNFLLFKKKSLKKELASINNDLRHRSTQITAALSLELLNSRVQSPILNKNVVEDTDVDSRYRKGENYYFGLDCDRNYTLAFEHYIYAAERRHTKSMCRVAEMYTHGHGIRPDDTIVFRWLVKAQEMGCPVGKFKLGLFLINEVSCFAYNSANQEVNSTSMFL